MRKWCNIYASRNIKEKPQNLNKINSEAEKD
jgi:hypothetical protein